MPARCAAGLPILFLATLLAAACGQGEAAAPRIAVETWAIDGPPPDHLVAVRVDRTGQEVDRHALRLLPGGDGVTYAIEGGADGFYRVEAPAGGWWMITAGGLPEVAQDRLPPRVRLGRTHTVYLVAPSLQAHVGTHWGVWRLDEDGEREAVPFQIEHEPPGYAAALRIDEGDWHGRLEIVGEVVAGAPGVAAGTGELVALTEPFPFEATPDGRGQLVPARVAATTSLGVRVVPVPGGEPVEDAIVRVRVLDVPLTYEVRRRVRDGVAHFDGVPTIGRPLAVFLGEDGATPRRVLDAEALRRTRGALVLGAGPRQAVDVALDGDAAPDAVLVRVPGAAAIAAVPFQVEGDVLHIELPRGGGAPLLLRRSDAWAVLADGPGTAVAPSSYEDGVRVTGRVEGVATAVRFLRLDTGQALDVDGLTLRVSPYGTYEGALPPGRYRVEVIGPSGVTTRPTPIDATTPGASIHLPLRAGS